MGEGGLIFWKRNQRWTGYEEVLRINQGRLPGSTLNVAIDVRKPIPIRITRSGWESEGGPGAMGMT